MLSCGDRINTLLCLIPANRLLSSSITEIPCNSARVNRGESRSYSLGASGHLQKIQVNGRIGSIRWSVDRADSTLFYGLAMDGKQGIILDNFSLRGSSGLSLRGIPKQMLRQFNEQRPYDLIILEYGLNVATERGRNYDNYQKGLLTAINHLKECFRKREFYC